VGFKSDSSNNDVMYSYFGGQKAKTDLVCTVTSSLSLYISPSYSLRPYFVKTLTGDIRILYSGCFTDATGNRSKQDNFLIFNIGDRYR
jgi:hypothetical protein